MPVFNVAQPQELDLTPVTPKTYSASTSEFIQLDPLATEATELGFNDTYSTGDIVNTGSLDDRGPFSIYPAGPTAPAPTKAEVEAAGIPIYPGGSSYHIPEGSKLRYFVACSGTDAELSAQYLG